ncbi:hypothetical protein LTR86_003952 [Recurvomyces mirabilis]|nr:hypothetical protein LTR86_003952 [Recurvomyces mirabilis]
MTTTMTGMAKQSADIKSSAPLRNVIWPEPGEHMPEALIEDTEKAIRDIVGSAGAKTLGKYISKIDGLIYWHVVCTASEAKDIAVLNAVAEIQPDIKDPNFELD